MRKYFLTTILTLGIAVIGFSQFKFGAGLTADIDDGFIGVNAKGKFFVNDEYAGQATFTYFFEDDNVTFWNIDLDVHYMGFEIGDLEGFNLTPFGGLHVSRANFDIAGVKGDTELGLNIGIQGVIPITDELELYIEPKIVIAGMDGFLLSAGVFF
jgi:outer membrane protein X